MGLVLGGEAGRRAAVAGGLGQSVVPVCIQRARASMGFRKWEKKEADKHGICIL